MRVSGGRSLCMAALLAQVSSTALLHPPRSRRALYAGGAALHQLASRRASCQPRAVPLCTAAAPPAEKPPYFNTTPIYYVNGQPHIGHAYTTLACDVIARFKRLDGHDVLFLTGTDEHGQKVQQSAEAAGETPQAFADRVSDTFRALLPVYNFSCDQFIRTTESRHTAAAQALWRKLLDSGDIYLGETFSCYISMCNCSAVALSNVGLKVEVQTQLQRETLSDSSKAESSIARFAPQQTLDRIIAYELRDVGIHILICSALYSDAYGEKKYFRKFFKFTCTLMKG